LQETGQDSHLRFYCLHCNLLTDRVIAIQKGMKVEMRTDLEKKSTGNV